jgi:hypothetical protein
MKLITKKDIPITIAIVPISLTNLASSIANVVSLVSALEARLAIYPITVSSPVLKTIPTPNPLVQAVPKNATFGLSNIFFVFSSGILKRSSDSPVRDALLTFISLVLIRMTSAGMLSPMLISTISPGTKSIA